MGKPLTFTKIERPLAIETFIENQHYTRNVKSLAKTILLKAFAHGAYVAGGSARSLLDISNKFKNDEGKLVEYLEENLMSSRRDIDLFFPSTEAIRGFMDSLPVTPELDVGLSKTGSAYNIDIPRAGEDRFRIFRKSTFQAIILPRAVGDIRDVMAGFDIQPSMVAFNNEGFIYPEESLELDERRIIVASKIETPFTLKRIAKYRDLYTYKTMDAETSDMYVDKVLELMATSKDREGIAFKYLPTNFTFTGENAKFVLKRVLHMLETPTLLKATITFVGDEYNIAFGTFLYRKRAERPESREQA